MIYADNAATTKLDIEAFEAMKPFLLEDYSNASQPYSFSRGAKKALKECEGFYLDMRAEKVNAIKQVVIEKLQLFGSAGKA